MRKDKKIKIELTQDELRVLSVHLYKLPMRVLNDDKMQGSPLESLMDKVEEAKLRKE